MATQGLGNMSPDQLRFEIQRGAKLVRYQYCVPLLVITFRRTGPLRRPRLPQPSREVAMKSSNHEQQ